MKTKLDKEVLASWLAGLGFTGIFWTGVYFIAKAIVEVIK